MKRALVWLRRDLRTHDNRAVELASQLADEVFVVFVYDTQILDALPDRSDRRVTFIHDSITEVHENLVALGGGLICRIGDPVEVLPQLIQELGVNLLVTARDFEPYAIDRDATVQARAAELGCAMEFVTDQVIFEGREILSNSGEPYKVYTPYSRAWKALLTPARFAEAVLVPGKLRRPPCSLGNVEMEQIGFQRNPPIFPGGARAAQARLAKFLDHVSAYGEQRDFPAIDATSALSVHLRFGTISIRECVRPVADPANPGEEKWLNELIWREFYQMILACFPHVATTAFRPEYQNLEWPGTREDFTKWCNGMTGYPVVDSAMRCLNATGWMHNRHRMICAMFLTKDLLCHWQWGEEYFAEKLLDFDLASNNGGWQWSASTGVDAQPYFRIFNPLLQSRKFDPEAKFILEWCPELAGGQDPHWPHDGLFGATNYPEPIVDHHKQKEKVLALFGRDSER